MFRTVRALCANYSVFLENENLLHQIILNASRLAISRMTEFTSSTPGQLRTPHARQSLLWFAKSVVSLALLISSDSLVVHHQQRTTLNHIQFMFQLRHDL